MTTLTLKFCTFKRVCANIPRIKVFKRNYKGNIQEETFERKIHPYKQIHPWRSFAEFTEDLTKNIIYHKDGLVALNKPYGIRLRTPEMSDKFIGTRVPKGVNYTISDALPYIAERLNYSTLNIVRGPEMYMSGITLLAADERVRRAIEVSIIRSNFFAKTYWVITIGVPRELKGEYRLALKLILNPQFKGRKAVLTDSWSKRDEKLGKVKVVKTEFQVLSNSTLNLSSLLQIKSSTERRHTIRLFASTFLYSPVLGDNSPCASRIQKVGDTYVKIDPFLVHPAPPKLDRRLLKLLNVTPSQQNLIPVHIHLRSIALPEFMGDDTLTIEAPVMPYFEWTCSQLEFKYFMQNNASCTE